MHGMNNVTLFGRLGSTPEARQIPSGQITTEFSMATSRRRKKGDEWVEETDWHRVQLWENQADVAVRYLSKGDPVLVEGSLRTDSWIDPEGARRFKTYVRGQRLHLLPNGGGSRIPHADSAPAPVVAEEEVPF